MTDTNYNVVIRRVAGWIMLAAALAVPFLTPIGEVNGAVLLGFGLLLAGAWLLDRSPARVDVDAPVPYVPANGDRS